MNTQPSKPISGLFPFMMALVLGTLCVAFTGCSTSSPADHNLLAHAIRAVDLTTPTHIADIDGPITLSGAGNEWLALVIQIDAARIKDGGSLRVAMSGSSNDAGHGMSPAINAYQILPVPIDLNRADYIRQTGNLAQDRAVPRVLFPLPRPGDTFDLRTLRDPADPTNPHAKPQRGPMLIWLDLHIPANAPAGTFQLQCNLLNADKQSLASLPVQLSVYDFSLPAAPSLQLVGQLDWASLKRIYPSVFDGITPRLLNRHDPRCAPAVQTLDRLVTLAHENHADAVVPYLQPTVKWPPGTLPEIDWTDYDSLLLPWMNGDAFTDHVPQGFWPLPAPDYLRNFDPASQSGYWKLAAGHFDQMHWLERSPVVLQNDSAGFVTADDRLILATQAREILSAYPRLSVVLPLDDNQVQLTSTAKANLIEPAATGRLVTACPGLVDTQPAQQWPANLPRPRHWLRTDSPGLVHFTQAAAGEHDLLISAWLAFAHHASMVSWGNTLPAMPSVDAPTDPNELIWFYPGQWFGVDHPLATIQLKWLRRAQQDYEYLNLAAHHGEADNASQIARLITKPVSLAPGQTADPTFALLSGTTDTHAWIEARQLLAGWILHAATAKAAHPPEQPLDLKTTRWLSLQQRPTPLVRGVQWLWSNATDAPAGNWLEARIAVDLYGPADDSPDANALLWTSLATGWQVHPQPIDVPPLTPYRVQRVMADARFDLDQITPDSRRPLTLTYQNGFTGRTAQCQFRIPVATSQRRRQSVNLDGSLGDWSNADALQLNQPLVRMLNRPALQQQQIQSADVPASIYSAWSDDHFYLAFRLNGIGKADARLTRNFVDYQSRRAWGEDLCEVLIQPVYVDNHVGPTLHLVCKPTGNWVEQEPGHTGNPGDWHALENAGVRYASSVDPNTHVWRGELAIPWQAISASGRGRPSLLRFNFIQHQNSTGQSASWAGPIDYGRDNAFMGLIQLRERPASTMVSRP